jgi:TolA-binding protein
MDENKQQMPQSQPQPPVAAAVDPDLHAIKTAMQQYGGRVVLALSVVVLVVVGVSLYHQRRTQGQQDAMARLLSARTVAEMTALAEQTSDERVAPLALLKLAKGEFDGSGYDKALARYDEFLKKYPQHDLAAVAEVGRNCCLEAMGQTQAALDGYAEFATANADHYLAPQALFGQARCMDALGRPDDARAIYEEFIATRTNSPWRDQAQESLSQVGRKPPAVAAVAPVNPGMMFAPVEQAPMVADPAPAPVTP